MPAEARVRTENADRYITRLCQHAGKMRSHLGHRRSAHAGGGAPPQILRPSLRTPAGRWS